MAIERMYQIHKNMELKQDIEIKSESKILSNKGETTHRKFLSIIITGGKTNEYSEECKKEYRM